MTGKEKKKGFIATSLIYSFFLVFALLMAAILATASENRVLVGAIKNDIYENLEAKSSYLISSLDINEMFEAGTLLSFARENWLVVNDTGDTVVLVKQKALTRQEIVTADASLYNDSKRTGYFGECSSSSCQVRTCYDNTGLGDLPGNGYCYYVNASIFRKPSFLPTQNEGGQNYGRTIPSHILEVWFNRHTGLKNVKSKLVTQEFTTNNGSIHYPKTDQEIYVRLLKKDEITDKVVNSLSVDTFHLLDIVSDTTTTIYDNGTIKTQSVTEPAYILPVIEVKKG